jgi:hypothetical protein
MSSTLKTVAELREKAARARRLAAGLVDAADWSALTEWPAALDAEAADLERASR